VVAAVDRGTRYSGRLRPGGNFARRRRYSAAPTQARRAVMPLITHPFARLCPALAKICPTASDKRQATAGRWRRQPSRSATGNQPLRACPAHGAVAKKGPVFRSAATGAATPAICCPIDRNVARSHAQRLNVRYRPRRSTPRVTLKAVMVNRSSTRAEGSDPTWRGTAADAACHHQLLFDVRGRTASRDVPQVNSASLISLSPHGPGPRRAQVSAT
jgi:hypothetical protein